MGNIDRKPSSAGNPWEGMCHPVMSGRGQSQPLCSSLKSIVDSSDFRTIPEGKHSASSVVLHWVLREIEVRYLRWCFPGDFNPSYFVYKEGH